MGSGGGRQAWKLSRRALTCLRSGSFSRRLRRRLHHRRGDPLGVAEGQNRRLNDPDAGQRRRRRGSRACASRRRRRHRFCRPALELARRAAGRGCRQGRRRDRQAAAGQRGARRPALPGRDADDARSRVSEGRRRRAAIGRGGRRYRRARAGAESSRAGHRPRRRSVFGSGAGLRLAAAPQGDRLQGRDARRGGEVGQAAPRSCRAAATRSLLRSLPAPRAEIRPRRLAASARRAPPPAARARCARLSQRAFGPRQPQRTPGRRQDRADPRSHSAPGHCNRGR